MAERSDTQRSTPKTRTISKKDANRIAAAKVYIAASEKAGVGVPDSVKRLADGIL